MAYRFDPLFYPLPIKEGDISLPLRISEGKVEPTTNDASEKDLIDLVRYVVSSQLSQEIEGCDDAERLAYLQANLRIINGKIQQYNERHYLKIRTIITPILEKVAIQQQKASQLGACQNEMLKLGFSSHPPSYNLQSLFPESQSTIPVDELERLIMHIHGGFFALDSGYEGNNPAKTFRYVYAWLKGTNQLSHPLLPHEELQKLTSRMQLTMDFLDGYESIISRTFAKYMATHVSSVFSAVKGFLLGNHVEDWGLANKILDNLTAHFINFLSKAQQEKKSFMVPGGWVENGGGHSINYELVPQDNGKWTFRLFNTGAGVNYHGEDEVVGFKEKIFPYYELTDIDYDKISDPLIIRALFEIIIFPLSQAVDSKTPPNTAYSAKDIYEAILPLFDGKLSVRDYQVEELMGPQRGGTCSWKSLNALMKSQLSLKDFQIYRYLIKRDSLIQYANSDFNPEIMEHILEKFAREVLRMKKDNLVSPEDLKNLEIMISTLAFKVDQKKFEALQKDKVDKSHQILYDPKPKAADTSRFKSIIDDTTSAPPQKLVSPFPFSEIQTWRPSPESLPEDLQTYIGLLETALKRGDGDSVTAFAFEVAKRIPNETSDFWEKANKDIVYPQLAKISEIVFKAAFLTSVIPNPHPEAVFVIVKFTDLMYEFSEHKISCPGIHYQRKWGFTIPDPVVSKELDRIFRKNSKAGRGLVLNRTELSQEQWGFTDNAQEYLRQILNSPGIEEKLRKKIPRYAQMVEKEKLKHLYVSDEILPQKFVQLRMQNYFLSIFVSNLKCSNPQDLSFSWELKTVIEKNTPELSFRGVFNGLSDGGKYADYMLHARTIKPELLQDYNVLGRAENSVFADHEHETNPKRLKFLTLLVTDRTRLYSTINYFNEYWEDLKDPSYQAIFTNLFFGEDLFAAQLRHDRGFVDKLNLFFNYHYRNYFQLGEIETCAFILQMQRYASRYNDQFKTNWYEKLQSMYDNDSISDLQRNTLRMHMLAAWRESGKSDRAELEKLYSDFMNNPLSFEWKDPVLISEIDKLARIYNLQIQSSVGITTLPPYLFESEVIKSILPFKVPPLVKEYETGKFEFEFEGERFRVFKKGHEIVAFRTFKGEWYQHAYREIHDTTKALLVGNELWKNSKNRCVIFPYQGTEPLYAITPKGVVERLRDKAILGKAYATQFEDSSETLAFYNPDKTLNSLEFPYLGLHFKVKNNKAYSEEIDGFYLAENQFFAPLERFPHYLLLQNDRGEVKVILRQASLSSQPKSALTQKPTFELGITKFYVMDWDKNFKTSDRVANLYLAYIFLSTRNYAQAKHFLEKGANTSKPFSEDEVKQLSSVANLSALSQNSHPYSIALQALAFYYLIENAKQHGQVGPIVSVKLVKDYINQITNMGTYALKRHQELAILEFGDGEAVSNRFLYHSGIPLPQSAKEVPPAPVTTESTEPRPNKIFAPNNTFKQIESFPVEHSLVTRPGKAFIGNFYKNYEIAQNGTPEQKERLRKEVQLCKNDPDKIIQKIRRILLHRLNSTDIEWPNIQELKSLGSIFSHKAFSSLPHIDSKLEAPKRNKIVTAPVSTASTSNFQPDSFDVTTEPVRERYQEFFKEYESALKGNAPAFLEARSTNILMAKESKKLIDEARIYLATTEKTYQLNTDPEELNARLDAHVTELKNQKLYVQDLLMKYANRMNRSDIDIMAGTEAYFTLQELILIFGKKDFAQYQLKNSRLTKEDLTNIHNLTAKFLTVETTLQKLERAKLKLSNVRDEKDDAVKDETIQGVASELLSERAYDLSQHPEFLVFEYFSNLQLRDDQVKAVETLQGKHPEFPVLQLIMGAGKTSVLTMLLAINRANGHNLSIVLLPQELLETVLKEMRQILGESFAQNVVHMEFNRQTPLNVQALKNLHHALLEIKSRKQCLLMSSSSVHSLYLKSIEALERGDTEEINAYRAILAVLKNDGDALIDEADLQFRCRHEVNYVIGKPTSLNREYYQLAIELYREYYKNPDLNALAQTIVQKKFPGLDQTLVLDYIQNRKDRDSIKHLDLQVQNSLALIKEELNNLLPFTQGRVADENYGVVDGHVLAIPFKASRQPSLHSQFGNPYEVMNFTIQYYLEKGISYPNFKLWIDTLKRDSMEEMRLNPSLMFEETKAFQRIRPFLGDEPSSSFFKITEKGWRDRLQTDNQNKDLIGHFLVDFVLPKIEVYPLKMSSNPQNLVSLFAKVEGFTGTVANRETFPISVRTEVNPMVDPKTLTILTLPGKASVQVIPNPRSEEELIDFIASNPSQMFVDAGALLKDVVDMNAFCHRLLARLPPPIDAIEFFNQKNHVVTISKKAHPQHKFTLIDQSHATGSNFIKPPTAIGIVTVGKNMFLRDLFQSVWRLRGIDKLQTVQLAIPSDVAEIVRRTLNKPEGDLNIEDVIQFTLSNQTKQQGEDNFLAMKQKLLNIPREQLIQMMADPSYSTEDVLGTFKKNKEYFVSSLSFEPLQLFGTREVMYSPDQAIEHLQTTIASKLPEDLPKPLDKILVRDQLPEQIRFSASSNEMTMELEVKKEVQTQQEEQVEQSLGNMVTNTKEWKKSKGFFDGNVFTLHEIIGRAEVARYFSPEIYFSNSLPYLTKNKRGNGLPKPELVLDGKPPREFEYLFVVKVGDKMVLSVLSQYNVDQLYTTSTVNKYCLYNMKLGILRDGTFTPEDLQADESFKRMLVQIKFLNGESFYTPQELIYLRAWIAQDPPAFKELFETRILRAKAHKRETYQISPLKALLNPEA